ncbi:MAG: hypothetical protein N2515_04280, partial [Deltaproteobacteria bacterium]|nr:hypothetical protein [Deltaproteobacteria bacterium]
MFERILIANRGEVLLRLTRTFHKLGIGVATFCSSQDAESHEAQSCDIVEIVDPEEAPGAPDLEKIARAAVRVARICGCSAIHPGYGIFDNSPILARAAEEAGICYLGPSAEEQVWLRDRALVQQSAIEAGLRSPFLLELHSPLPCPEELPQLPFHHPFLVKTTWEAGEGNVINRCLDSGSLRAWALNHASQPARYVLENWIERPRHIEVWLLSDGKEALPIADIESSVRRENRRFIAESPAPALGLSSRTEGKRAVLWAAAQGFAELLKIKGLLSAHFLLDPRGFLNFVGLRAGLSHEHVLVEMCTGEDLVHLELHLLSHQSLSSISRGIESSGNAIQARIEAPLTSKSQSISELRWPLAPQGTLRIESALHDGYSPRPSTPPTIATFTTHGITRHDSILSLDRALA